MEMLDKELERHVFADYLESLANQFRAGKIETENREWTVSDQLHAKIRIKEKKGRIVGKLSWQWSSLADYDQGEKREYEAWQDSYKMVKKKMGSSFKQLVREVEKSGFPSPQSLEDFVASSEAFVRYADPEWQEEMQIYMDHLENLKRAVADRQEDQVGHEVRDLTGCMKSCHREYK